MLAPSRSMSGRGPGGAGRGYGHGAARRDFCGSCHGDPRSASENVRPENVSAPHVPRSGAMQVRLRNRRLRHRRLCKYLGHISRSCHVGPTRKRTPTREDGWYSAGEANRAVPPGRVVRSRVLRGRLAAVGRVFGRFAIPGRLIGRTRAFGALNRGSNPRPGADRSAAPARFEWRGRPVQQSGSDGCDLQDQRLSRVGGVLAGERSGPGEPVCDSSYGKVQPPGRRGGDPPHEKYAGWRADRPSAHAGRVRPAPPRPVCRARFVTLTGSDAARRRRRRPRLRCAAQPGGAETAGAPRRLYGAYQPRCGAARPVAAPATWVAGSVKFGEDPPCQPGGGRPDGILRWSRA